MSDPFRPVIGIIGGTGDLGSGLAKAWVAAGHRVIIGSRSREKAEKAAAALGEAVSGDDNVGAARAADVVVLAVPFASHDQTIEEIKGVVGGKIFVDTAVPLVPPKVSTVQLPSGGSAAQIAQRLLGSEVRVVSAFHNVSAAKLHAGGRVDCDVLVFSDDKAARNSVAAEAMTSVLIWINRQYKTRAAGIGITGLETAGPT
jgi:8-hydroxy-5-deazaflavin:NADPH oxidoreductase